VDKVLFVQIAKVDVEKREVWGRAVEEVADKAKEIFDYGTSAPLFRSWSAGFEKATAATGQETSLGNVRAMHGKVAAGKVIAIDFNDVDKAIDIGTKVVDDGEWKKVEEGVYTGFSIGGSYVKKWKDGELTRYTAQPAEISLVDNPCVPTARFTMVKADGVTEEKEFSKASPAPAAPAPDPAAQTGGETAKAAAAITDPAVEPVATPVTTGSSTVVQKSLYSVQSFASILSYLAGICSDAQYEAAMEGDNSPVPAQLREWLRSGLEILGAMTAEESAELVASLDKAASAKLAKGKGHAQSIHDSSVSMGANCSSSKAAAPDDLAKVAGDLEKVTTERDTLKKRVAELEAQPEPAKGVAKVVVGKETDSAIAKVNEEPEDNTPLGLMKKAQSQPQVIVKV
jgi:hypothetical protein